MDLPFWCCCAAVAEGWWTLPSAQVLWWDLGCLFHRPNDQHHPWSPCTIWLMSLLVLPVIQTRLPLLFISVKHLLKNRPPLWELHVGDTVARQYSIQDLRVVTLQKGLVLETSDFHLTSAKAQRRHWQLVQPAAAATDVKPRALDENGRLQQKKMRHLISCSPFIMSTCTRMRPPAPISDVVVYDKSWHQTQSDPFVHKHILSFMSCMLICKIGQIWKCFLLLKAATVFKSASHPSSEVLLKTRLHLLWGQATTALL